MSPHDEWSLINIIMLLGYISHTMLYLEYAHALHLCAVCVCVFAHTSRVHFYKKSEKVFQ